MDYGGNGLGAPSKRGRTAVGVTRIGLGEEGLVGGEEVWWGSNTLTLLCCCFLSCGFPINGVKYISFGAAFEYKKSFCLIMIPYGPFIEVPFVLVTKGSKFCNGAFQI